MLLITVEVEGFAPHSKSHLEEGSPKQCGTRGPDNYFKWDTKYFLFEIYFDKSMFFIY